jgi:hypothetical protein
VETRKRPANNNKKLPPNKRRLPSADWLHPLAAGHVTRNFFFFEKKFPAVFEFVVCNRFLLLLDVQSSAEMTRSAGAQWTPRRCGRRLRPKIIGNTLAQNRIALFHILAFKQKMRPLP